MLDLGYVRANLALVEERLRSRGVETAAVLGDFAAVDAGRREAITRVESLKADRNRLTGEIAALRKAGGDATAITEQTKAMKAEVEALEATAALADERLRMVMQSLPNLPANDVPLGKSEQDNRVEKTWGEQTAFDFPALPHWRLASGWACSTSSALRRSRDRGLWCRLGKALG